MTLRMMSLTELEKLPVHPDAEIFRMMTQEETLTLAESLSKVGMTDAITIFNGQLLDGRNRRDAARIAGLAEVPVLEFAGADTLALVIAKNLTRRNLDIYDKVEVGARLRAKYEGRGGGWQGNQYVEYANPLSTTGPTGETPDLVAQELHGAVGSSTLKAGWALMERYPEIWKEAKRTGEGVATALRRATSPPTDMKNYTLKGALATVTQGEELLRSVAAWRRSVGTNRAEMSERQLAKVAKVAKEILVHADAILNVDTGVPTT